MSEPDLELAAGHSGKDKEKKLAAEPIGKLFISLAIPSIISQIVNLLYSVVDRMYVGYIPETGTVALTALGVCVPIITLVSSFAQLVSSGAAPLASIQLGSGQKSRAEQILGNSFTAMLLMAVALTAVLLIFTEPILKVFGASEVTMPYAAAYLRIYACSVAGAFCCMGFPLFHQTYRDFRLENEVYETALAYHFSCPCIRSCTVYHVCNGKCSCIDLQFLSAEIWR